ncbi:MAG TPA: class I adenylate-forming enzyme family protein [Candidatus Binatia bacterium]
MKNLFQVVATHAAHSGSKIAASKWRPGAGFVETSYGALFRDAKRLAALYARLTPADSIVPMLVGKSAASIACMLAAIAARRPFCFVNPKYRAPQVAAILQATKAPVAITDAAGLVALRGACRHHPALARTTWVVLESEAPAGIHAQAMEELRAAANVIVVGDRDEGDDRRLGNEEDARPNAAAVCLFTSGSTGQPKGVLISEADLMRRVAAEIALFGLTSADVLLSVLPFSFDVGLNQLMTALAVGGEIVLLDSWLPRDILTAAEVRRVTGISGVPSIWQDVIHSGVRFDKRGRQASLRYVTISGGSLPEEYLRKFPEILDGVQIFKTYGQTEAFRATSLRPEEYHRKLGSVGRPFTDVRVYVVREDGTRCRAGEVGEVIHSGLGTMMGYLESTADTLELEKKLRRNPFCGEDDPAPFAIFTGDMGYLDEEGYLFLKGRRDSMLKIMGNRVYPQEVHNQILTVPGVKDAVVVGIPRNGQTMLVAFLAIAEDVDLNPASVAKSLTAKLPTFMIPKEIVFVDHMPRTLTGKPDQQKLVAEYGDGGVRTPPQTAASPGL